MGPKLIPPPPLINPWLAPGMGVTSGSVKKNFGSNTSTVTLNPKKTSKLNSLGFSPIETETD